MKFETKKQYSKTESKGTEQLSYNCEHITTSNDAIEGECFVDKHGLSFPIITVSISSDYNYRNSRNEKVIMSINETFKFPIYSYEFWSNAFFCTESESKVKKAPLLHGEYLADSIKNMFFTHFGAELFKDGYSIDICEYWIRKQAKHDMDEKLKTFDREVDMDGLYAVGVVCKDRKDFENFKNKNDVVLTIDKNRFVIHDQDRLELEYKAIYSERDLCSCHINDYIVTRLARTSKEFEITMNIIEAHVNTYNSIEDFHKDKEMK